MRTYTLFKIFLIISYGFISNYLFSQRPVEIPDLEFILQPTPQKFQYHGSVILFEKDSAKLQVLWEREEEGRAALYLKKILEDKYSNSIDISMTNDQHENARGIRIKLNTINDTPQKYPSQFYTIKSSKNSEYFEIKSASSLGLLYGVVTFCDLIQISETSVLIPQCLVEDWPDFSRRIFPAVVDAANVKGLMDFALQNKIETIALASRQYSWNKVDSTYLEVLQEIKKWKDRFGAPNIMQMHNIYHETHIEISNKKHVKCLKKVIEAGLLHGTDKLMILADDTPPFKFGEGYILENTTDKKQFSHMAEAHCSLMTELRNWITSKNYQCELYYVPPFYTYEEMYYGDMSLYKNTPWEASAYSPLERDLKYIGNNLPADIFIVWSGPNVRSRVITIENVQDWTNKLQGRIPFLWDNTIYSHHPFTTTALFTGYSNVLPDDFANMTSGNGMYINGDVNSEEMKAAMITVNDYLWNTDAYDSTQSIITALERQYESESVDLLVQFRDTELQLRRLIGERALWYTADTLWTIIKKAKTITGKNPFYYHLNYNRLKALRMQLKYSVPEQLSIQEFEEKCNFLQTKRNHLLGRLKILNPTISNYLTKIMIEI